MPVKTCACGLDLKVRKKALICDHCDAGIICDSKTCVRCRAIGLKPRS